MIQEGHISNSLDNLNFKNYIAKTPTQQPEFLEEYPHFDGRNILIGIIDTSIDVSLPGLQQTSTGLSKIVDCFDLTGNGYVNTSVVKKADNNNLIGLTGRNLKIPSTWKNPSGKWHLGIKSIYELCDFEARAKITSIRKNKLKKDNQNLKNLYEEIANEEDSNFMFEYFDATEELSSDSLISDCIVWNNGKEWQACIDTSFKGDLKNVKILTNYRDCHEYGVIFDQLVYCFNIRENGNILEIYVPYDEHGTVIANICAGYYSNEPEKNGLAPGAQIISFAVLDPRNCDCVNSQAIIQAFHKCIEMKVDIVNISVGGIPDDAYELMVKMVEEHGIIIVNAVGNNGPVYQSIKEMGCFQNLLLNIGSCLNDEMIYNIDTKENLRPKISSFSSQGPMPESGACGITFVAPGHGYADLPKHFPCKTQIFEGTSYACPNALGAISCLISGLKAKALPITFLKVKLALINTAFLPDECNKLAYGNGIIQIKKAFEFYLENLLTFPIETTNITTTIIKLSENKIFNLFDKNNYQNGILLKVVERKRNIYTFNVKINVINCSSKGNPAKIDWKLKLSPNAKHFVKECLILDQRNIFSIKININSLNENSIYYAEIIGYDSKNSLWGPLFHFPVTVIIPKNFYETEKINEVIKINSIFPYRLFIPPFSSEFSRIYVKLEYLEEEKPEVTLQMQICFGEKKYHTDNTKELKFNKKDYIQSCEFEIFDCNEIHEICIIAEDVQIEKKLNFVFQLCFIGRPSILSKIKSLFFKQSDNSIDNVSFNDSLCSSFSLKSDKITYNLFSQKLRYKCINGKEYCMATYYFKVMEKTYCEIFVKYPGIRYLNAFKAYRIQVYTLSKKFVTGFIDAWGNDIPLNPGEYVIKALFELHNIKIFHITLPFLSYLPVITLTTNSANALKTFWTNSFDVLKKFTNSLKGNFGNYFFHFGNIKMYLNNVHPHDVELWHNIILKHYIAHGHKDVKNIANMFLQRVNAKNFLRNYDNIKNHANFYEREMIKTRKLLIINVLFYKADSILNEYLKKCDNMPKIFKHNFGFDVFNYELNTKNMHPSLFNILWSLLTYDIYLNPSKQSNNNHRSKLQYQNDNTDLTNNITNFLPKRKTFNLKYIKQNILLFYKSANDSDIRKILITIKKALLFGNFGTTLFYLNKIAAENQTIPNYKLFDEAIIQLLKQLEWNHLIEAHHSAILDRHRSYYRIN